MLNFYLFTNTMIIRRIKLDITHWSSDYIPISYINIISEYQKNKSFTYIWSNKYNLYALCRCYYIAPNIVELGDVWLTDELRGKIINVEKKEIGVLDGIVMELLRI